jgi:hypothetical protein
MGLLSNFWARSRPCPLVVLYPVDHEAGWTPIDILSSAPVPSRAPGTAPAGARARWDVAGQTPSRQHTLADVYQWFRISLTERQKAWLFARAPQYRKYLNHQ